MSKARAAQRTTKFERYFFRAGPDEYVKWGQVCQDSINNDRIEEKVNERNHELAWSEFKSQVIKLARSTLKYKKSNEQQKYKTPNEQSSKKKYKLKQPSVELRALITQRRNEYEKAKRTNEWNEYTRLKRKVKRKARREREKEVRSMRDAIRDEKKKRLEKFWKLLTELLLIQGKKVKRQKKSPAVKNEHGNLISDDEGKKESLA